MTEPTILVHGGAWDIPERWREDTVVGCCRAADAGHAVLAAGGSALDAVVAAIRVLEDHPSLGAGRGAAMDKNGDFHLDAALMRGHDLAAAAAGWIPATRHPIDLARAILEHSPHVLLVGEEALAWGEEYGVKPCDPAELRTPKNMERIVWGQDDAPTRHGHDTVGAIALDAHGHIVAGLSTGGTPGRHPARVGDVPVIGAGLYAEDGLGGAAATGSGEGIIRVTLARMCLEDIRHGAHPQAAAEARLRHMNERTGLKGGLILLDAQGRVGLWHSTEAMCFAKRGGEAFEGWRVG